MPNIRETKVGGDMNTALNAVCPYFTMFPLDYPLRILRRHHKESPVVLDPYCGRGTTIFAARACGFSAWGIDTNPVAVAIARAKLSIASTEEVISLASRLMAKAPRQIPDTPFFKRAFHPEVLRDICAIRDGLMRLGSSDAADLLRAVMLGCLHGPKAKVIENSGYFSNQMQRTFSPKPDYAVRFWKANGFKAPKISVLGVIRRKAERFEIGGLPVKGNPLQIIHGNSEKATTFSRVGENPSLVITSPPYYGMRTYVQDQWLRNWFLGGPEVVDYSTGDQVSHLSQEDFVSSLSEVWNRVGESRASKVDLYFRIGQIPSRKSDALALAKDSLKGSSLPWRLVSVRSAKTAWEGKRQAVQMATESSAALEYDLHAVRD